MPKNFQEILIRRFFTSSQEFQKDFKKKLYDYSRAPKSSETKIQEILRMPNNSYRALKEFLGTSEGFHEELLKNS